jgi:hypothetical protein
MRRSRVLTLAAVAVLGVGSGAALYVWNQAGSSTAVGADSVLKEFREQYTGGDTARPNVPEAGVYAYRATGKESIGAGGFDTSRGLAARAHLTVLPTAEGYETRLDYSEEHLEGARYAVDAKGTSLVWTRTKVTFLGQGSDDIADVAPPVLWVPAKPKVGQRWSGSYEADGTAVKVSHVVLKTATATVAGKRIPVVEIKRTTDSSGKYTGTFTDVILWSTELSLPISIETSGGTEGGGGSFSQDSTLEIEATTPQR